MDEIDDASGPSHPRDTAPHGGSLPINRNGLIPLHHQVRTYLLGCIERGELQPGQQILQEREYAARFGISLAPVRQAILDLVKEGYLYRMRGRGTFVREAKVEEKINILSSFTESLRAKGLSADLRIVDSDIVSAPEGMRRFLARPDQRVLALRRVAVVEGEGIALLSAYVPVELVPGLETVNLEGLSLYQTLEARYGIVLARAETAIEVVRCRAEEAALLGIPQGTPLMLAEGATYDVSDRFIEYSRILYRADRFRFTLESFRRDDRVLTLIGAPEREENRQT
jgi:DNA-binding GntR family transcriptional regulator